MTIMSARTVIRLSKMKNLATIVSIYVVFARVVHLKKFGHSSGGSDGHMYHLRQINVSWFNSIPIKRRSDGTNVEQHGNEEIK